MLEKEHCGVPILRLHRSRRLLLLQSWALACFSAVSFSANALGFYSGSIVSQQAQVTGTEATGITGAFFVYINGVSGQSPPACATSTGRFVANSTIAAGQAQVAVILSALARGATVSIQGSGACDVWPDTETILWILSN
jgi:hypothetical protein